jgi:acetyltransferase-like isoleucine patch superfamily enzyme
MSADKVHPIKKAFRLRQDMSMGFIITDFIFRKIFRQNAGVKWAVHHTATIHCPEQIKRGAHVFPGDSPGVYINAVNGVHIGDYTNIGPNVGIVSANHDAINNAVQVKKSPIIIGRFCWLGMGAVILPGVQLGDFTIVGAGSIVTKSFTEGYCILAGNPAKIIKQLNKKACETFAGTKTKSFFK